MASCSSLALPAKSLWRRCFSHGGHSVHSPFAFELLTRVVEEKSPYSAFASIREVVHRHGRSKHDLRLAFLFYRVSAHYPIKRIQVLGADCSYMQELCNIPLAFGASLWPLPSGGPILPLLYHGGGGSLSSNRRANSCDITRRYLAKSFSKKAHDSVLQRGASLGDPH